MVHRFDQAVRLAVFGLLAMAVSQPASAEEHFYEGVFTLCIPTCDSFAALGGPGGAANVQPSDVSGSIEIPGSGPSASFSFTEGDNLDFLFEIFNSNVPVEEASFDTDGTFLNPTTANPLPLSPDVAAVSITGGTTDANGVLNGGEMVFRFTQPPFSSNTAYVYFDLSTGNAEGFLFVNVILFTNIEGTFSIAPGAIEVGGAPVTFADTAVGQTDTADVTVTNTGTGNLSVASVATTDMLADPFSVSMDGCTGQSLAPMATCTIEVEFAPTTASGAFSDSFDIVTNDPDTPSVTVDVSGTALEANLEATPFPLNFVQTTVDEVSQAVATVTNTGAADLIIGMIDTAGLDSQFSVALDNCSMMTLAPDAACQITMEFAPLSEGVFMSEFVIPSNDLSSPSFSYEVQGEGIIGTVANITIIPESLSFDEILAGEMAELSIQVSSSGNDPLQLMSFALSGDDAAEFSQTNDCPDTLPSGSSCTVNVVFAPLTGGSKSAILTIESNGAVRPILDIVITASAFSGPRIVVEPAALDLGGPSAPIDVGGSTTADVTVSNTGTSDLTVGTLDFDDAVPGSGDSAEFAVDNNGCTMAVAPQGSCMITVRFSPLTEADKSAILLIASDDADNPSTSVGLTGYVFRGPRVDVPDTTIDVDGGEAVEIGQTADFDLVISNSGTEDLDITGFALGGDDADEFGFNETCVGTPVVPDGTCTVTITFTPTSSGEKSAELSIFSNDVTLVRAMTIAVQLTATATAPPVDTGPAPGSETITPPPFALSDPGGGSVGFGLLGLGVILLIARRRYR